MEFEFESEEMKEAMKKVEETRKEYLKALHDLGKIGINDSILNKAGRLTQEEYEQIMLHPTKGAEIISKVDFLKDVSKIIKHHHDQQKNDIAVCRH